MVTQPGVYKFDYARVPAAPVVALGAAAGVPGVARRRARRRPDSVPPEAAKIKQENSEHWIDRDPELKCYLPGIRARCTCRIHSESCRAKTRFT